MSVLLIFRNKDVEPWARQLKEKLHNVLVEVYPEVNTPADVDFVVCWKPPKDVLSQFPNIKIIQSVGASVDHILNTQQLYDKIKVARIVDKKLSLDMWEFVLSLVMGRIKNTGIYKTQQSAKIWKQEPYKSIDETTVSILGLGKIGALVARKFAGLGFKVKAWSRSEKNIPGVKSYIGNDGLRLCLQGADFLINLLPLTPETKHILNKTTLQKLPSHACLINVGRGEHLFDSDLVEWLDASKSATACLDVFDVEPLPQDHVFWNHPKIQLTPHVASLTNIDNATDQIAENYRRFTNHQEIQNIVSLKKAY